MTPHTVSDRRNVSSKRGTAIHWKAYTTMFTSLLCGLLLAAGHHMFYTHLNGQPTGSAGHNLLGGVTRQQLNTTIGTIFAFLVKAFLVIAISIAYAQIMWRDLKKQPAKVDAANAVFSALSSIWSLLHLSVWRRYPLLLLLACAAWLIPIASVISPGALTVGTVAKNPTPTNLIRVPQVDFTSLNFANIVVPPGTSKQFIYRNSRYAVDQIAVATSAQGSILNVQAPAPNSSWELNFDGPAIICTNLEGSTLDDVNTNLDKAMNYNIASPLSPNFRVRYGYVSWTPGAASTNTNDSPVLQPLPFTYSKDTNYTFQAASLGPLADGLFDDALGTDQLGPATLYIATNPSMGSAYGQTGSNDSDASVIQCRLYNTSYDVSFSVVNGQQTIDVVRNENMHNLIYPIASLDTTGVLGFGLNPNASGPTTWNFTEVQSLAYQAVMDSFGKLLVGTIWNSEASLGSLITTDSSIMSTVLANSPELAFLMKYGVSGGVTLQGTVSEEPSFWNGLDVVETTTSNVSLRQATESLFQNITISLMTSSLLQPNYSSPYAPPPVQVMLPEYRQIYIYTPSKLWIAYGIAISITTICALVGFLAILANGASYTTDFSTILRTTRYARLDIQAKDIDGEDPLPKYLAKTKISFYHREQALYQVTGDQEVSKTEGVNPDLGLLDRGDAY